MPNREIRAIYTTWLECTLFCEDKSQALRQLELAVQKGYSDANKLALDSVFESIRDMPEFKKILRKIQ